MRRSLRNQEQRDTQGSVKMVTSQSRCARASGSPWGCSPPSSLPLCGSVMTHWFPVQRVATSFVTHLGQRWSRSPGIH